MKKEEWLEDYKLKAESIIELDTDIIRKNLAKIILVLIEEINSRQQLSARAEKLKNFDAWIKDNY